MPMRKCPTCGNDVSTEAVSCPKCGHQFKAPGGFNIKDPVHGCGCAIILGLLVLMLYLALHG
jgi:hypothetical protein